MSGVVPKPIQKTNQPTAQQQLQQVNQPNSQ
jgi:hypothetical protein